MDRKISLIGNFASDWIRYNDYEFKENEQGELYIVPTAYATFSMYNPFDVADDLLVELMQLGQEALKPHQSEESLKKMIITFAKKYGLFGFISSSVYNRDIIGDEHVLLIENNPITNEKAMTVKKYVNKFIPFAEEGDVEFIEYKKCTDVRKSEDSPKFYGKRPVVIDLIFSRFYAEQVKWIIDFAKMMVSHFDQILTYKGASAYLTEEVTILAGKFNANKIGFTINQLDRTTIAWEFDSLKTAIQTIYAFAVTDEDVLINRCPHCNKMFIAKNQREKYCCVSCRNRANVYKSRSRKTQQSEEQ